MDIKQNDIGKDKKEKKGNKSKKNTDKLKKILRKVIPNFPSFSNFSKDISQKDLGNDLPQFQNQESENSINKSNFEEKDKTLDASDLRDLQSIRKSSN